MGHVVVVVTTVVASVVVCVVVIDIVGVLRWLNVLVLLLLVS